MLRFHYALLSVCLLVLSTSLIRADDTALTVARQRLAETAAEFAPDKRVEIFDVEAKIVDGVVTLSGVTSSQAAKESLAEATATMPNVVDKIVLLPAASLGERTFGVVNLSVATLRYQPSHSAEPGLQALLGTPVRVLQSDRWYYVQTPNKYVCYVPASSIVRMTRDEFNDWTSAQKIVFVSHYGFAYERPDVESQTVSDMVSGCMLKRESENGEFYGVAYPDGRKGFVLKSQSMPFELWEANIDLTAESVLGTAKSLMGLPYLWAGNSSKAVDCSGLTSLCFFLHGVIVPRDSSQQVHVGQAVELTPDFKNLQPADLLFFGSCDDEGNLRRIWHVGFYIGGGEFIHSAGRVHISSLIPGTPHYDQANTETLVRVRRYLGQIGTPGIEKIIDSPFYKVQQ